MRETGEGLEACATSSVPLCPTRGEDPHDIQCVMESSVDIMYMFRVSRTLRKVCNFEFRAFIQDQTWREPLNWSSPTFHFTDEETEAVRKYIFQFSTDTSQLEKRPEAKASGPETGGSDEIQGSPQPCTHSPCARFCLLPEAPQHPMLLCGMLKWGIWSVPTCGPAGNKILGRSLQLALIFLDFSPSSYTPFMPFCPFLHTFSSPLTGAVQELLFHFKSRGERGSKIWQQSH